VPTTSLLPPPLARQVDCIMGDSSGQPKTATLFQTIKVVLSAFVGIRKHQELKVKPLHVIITGIIAAALFVLTVTTVVRLVLK
jgi:Protein of unknown function (DUF2970)